MAVAADRGVAKLRVLVVDDSGFFRRRLTEILESDPLIQVVGTAEDGRDAVAKALTLRPDVITMDVEMPVMDGISAVRRIMSVQPTPILMFSSLTHEGARATLDALEAGAMDFLPKRFEAIAEKREEAHHQLCQRVRGLVRRRLPAAATAPARPALRPKALRHSAFRLVAVGTSTGGPVALQQLLTALPADFPLPLVLIQHMPASFTPAFAERLDRLCAIRVREARDRDTLEPGLALLAPGGQQMMVEEGFVRILPGPPELHYRPCVDLTFGAAARAYPGRVLALVLTGMGQDGREGARLLKQGGATVWAQDEESCVVFGMPAAVIQAGLADRVLPLGRMGPALAGSE